MRNLINKIIIIGLCWVVLGCTDSYEPNKYFTSQAEKDSLIDKLLPYVLPKPTDLPLSKRFTDSMKVFYRSQIEPNELTLHKYYISKDSVHYGLFIRRDLKSLYVDYRAIAATYNKKNDSIYNIELKFLTPMFRKDSIYDKSNLLFKTLVKKGDINDYIGNRNFVDWPSKDVYYDKVERKWALRKNSEWDRLKEEAKKVQ